MKELIELQSRFSSTKDLRNEFANFNYRNVEEMAKNLKPLLYELGCTVTFSDEIENVGTHNYLKTTCTITNSDGESVSNTAYAREDESRSGNCAPQLTGAASTYGRKYALCGLLFVDSGEKDPDSLDNSEGERKEAPKQALRKTQNTEDKSYSPDKAGVEEFIKERWEKADKETKHLLSAFHMEATTNLDWITKYSVASCYRYLEGDIKSGKKKIVWTVPPGVNQKGFWKVERAK